MANFYTAYQASRRLTQSLIKRKGIVGIGVGYANPKKPSNGAGVIIYTEKASTESALSLPQSISAKYKGKEVSVPIRIVVTGPVYANMAVTPKQYRGRIRPVQGGYSVGVPTIPGSGGWSGTAGVIGINYPAQNQLYVCSNNHVLNRNNSAGYTETIQPGASDGGVTGTDQIGRLDRFVRLRKDAVNYLDAATSIPLSNTLLNPRYAVIGVLPGHLNTYRVGERFKKVGRTTGFVRGTVESVNVTANVNYGTYAGLGVIPFRNLTVVVGTTPVSLPGDSGSIWLRDSDNYAAAVNFAGDGLRSYCFPFQWFAQAFGLRVAAPAGSAGKVKIPRRKLSYAYARPLTKQELAEIKVEKAKRK